jgi:hypothetical protein
MTVSSLAQAQCECCGFWFPRGELLRQLRARPEPAGQNLLPYSDYDAAGWSSSAVDDGNTAWGNQVLGARVSLDDDGTTTTEVDGAQTWAGDGTISSDATVDLSSYTTVRMELDFAPHQADCGGSYTVTIGVKKGANVYPVASFVAKGQRVVRGDIEIATIDEGDRSALTVYVDVDAPDADHRWCVERLRLWDRETHGDAFVGTSGAAVTRTSTTVATGAEVVCEECKDPRLDRIKDYEHERYEPGEIAEDLELD